MTARRPTDAFGQALEGLDADFVDLSGAFAQPASPLTEAQEVRVREIAIEVVVAASRVQAGIAAGYAIDRLRVSAQQVEEFLDGDDRERYA